MVEHNQHRAIRLQSMALVVAAFITTAGAITSAVIQSGWVKPSSTTAGVASQSIPKRLASLVGTVEPLDDNAVAGTSANWLTPGQNVAVGNLAEQPITAAIASAQQSPALVKSAPAPATIPYSRPLWASPTNWFSGRKGNRSN